MKMTKERMEQLTEERYDAVGEVLFGKKVQAEFTEGRDQLMNIMVSNTALLTAMAGSIDAMAHAEIITHNDGVILTTLVSELTQEIQKAVVRSLPDGVAATTGTVH